MSLMNSHERDDRELIRYLVGALTDEEAARLDERQQQLEQQLRQEQSASAEARQELDRLRQSPAQRQGSTTPVVAFVLVPPIRGIGEIPTLPIPRGTGTVSLQITLEPDDIPVYHVALRDSATGQVIWRSADLQPTTRAGARAVSVTLDAALLQARTYTLEVTGVRARGPA